MVISTEVKMDMMNKSMFGTPPRIKVMQNDRYSRNIVFTLFDGGVEWNIPTDAETVVRFSRKNGTGGNYSQMPDGTDACEHENGRNVLTVRLAPAVTIAPGPVQVSVGIIIDDQEINTFSVVVDVEPNPGLSATSEGHYKILGSLPDSGWEPNMYLGTDNDGNVVTKEAPESSGAGLTDEQARKLDTITITEDGYTEISGLRMMTNFSVIETGTSINMDIALEGDETHSHVINFGADGYPTSITVDGVVIPGTWEVST